MSKIKRNTKKRVHQYKESKRMEEEEYRRLEKELKKLMSDTTPEELGKGCTGWK